MNPHPQSGESPQALPPDPLVDSAVTHDQPSLDAGLTTEQSATASVPMLPTAPTATSAPVVRVEGLAETLHDVRHELALISHATKYEWVNKRLILFRNALIAMSILVVVIVAAVACYREAYRQTMTVAAFDVPESLAERGITGQVVAKAVFDELIIRRDLVTNLEAGELKGAWAENRADVAIPEAKFTLQSVFRYLRYMTGNEIAVDGEIILNGDNATMKVRVAGRPPTIVTGPMSDWQKLVGALANGVLEVTQPAVLAGYLGAQAKTPEDLRALSKHLIKMQNAAVRPRPAVMSVAYDAYGSALLRQGKTDEAQAAFAEAMALDNTNGVAVINAANLQSVRRNYVDAAVLYRQAQSMRLPGTVKARALLRRLAGAINSGDCPAAAQALSEAKASPDYRVSETASGEEAYYIVQCEFEEARAVALIERHATLHPDASRNINALGLIQGTRPERRYLDEAIAVFRKGIAAGVEDIFMYSNLAAVLAQKGEYEEALEWADRANTLNVRAGGRPSLESFNGYVHYLKREYAQADATLRRLVAATPLREEQDFLIFAGTQVGLGRFDEAIKVYNDGLALLPKSCNLWEAFGQMYATQGDVVTALATFDKGIVAVPKCGLNYNSAARLLVKNNRVPEAKQKLNALITIAPKSDGAVIAKEILLTLTKPS